MSVNLEQLPRELLVMILQNLSHASLLNVMLVNKHFNDITSHPSLWRKIARNSLHILEVPSFCKRLACCSLLVDLSIPKASIVDRILMAVAKVCVNLKRLDISQTKITTTYAFGKVCHGCPNLHTLNIDRTVVKKEKSFQLMEMIASLKSLRVLSLNYCSWVEPLHLTLFRVLEQRLNFLQIQPSITDGSVNFDFETSCGFVSMKPWLPAPTFTGLMTRSVNVSSLFYTSSGEESEEDLKNILQMPRLRSLWMQMTNICPTIIPGAFSARQLNLVFLRLELSSSWTDNMLEIVLPSVKTLHYLYLEKFDLVTSAGFDKIPALRNLEIFSIVGTPLKLEVFKRLISNIRTLRVLGLYGTTRLSEGDFFLLGMSAPHITVQRR